MVSTGTRRIRVMLGVLMVSMLMPSMVSYIHHVMVHLRRHHDHGALAIHTRRRAQHCSRDRTPDREQHGKQHQQANTNDSHNVRLARGSLPSVTCMQLRLGIVELAPLARSSPVLRPAARPVHTGTGLLQVDRQPQDVCDFELTLKRDQLPIVVPANRSSSRSRRVWARRRQERSACRVSP